MRARSSILFEAQVRRIPEPLNGKDRKGDYIVWETIQEWICVASRADAVEKEATEYLVKAHNENPGEQHRLYRTVTRKEVLRRFRASS